MTYLLGGKVEKAKHREYGKAALQVKEKSPLFEGLPDDQIVWMSHGDLVADIPNGFKVDAVSPSCPFAAISNDERNMYGVQFHPEVRHTEFGNGLLKNFVFRICGCTNSWTMENFIEMQIENIRKTVGNKKVLCALSGGVDSSVVAVLIHKAIGNQLTCIFVDHGPSQRGSGKRHEDV